MPTPEVNRGSNSRGRSTEHGRTELVNQMSLQYKVRLLSGQFDSGIPLDRVAARDGIRRNNPTETYQRIHEKWGETRQAEWAGDRRRDFSERLTAWAGSRARDLKDLIDSTSPDDSNFFDGLATIKFTGDPQSTTQEDIASYFAGTFFPEFAVNSDRNVEADKSVGHLVDTFYQVAGPDADGKITQAGADKVMDQVQALYRVLRPIFKEENYLKFEDVLQARLHAGSGRLNEANIKNGDPSQKMKQDLGYFAPQTLWEERPRPTVAVGRAVRLAEAAAVAEPTGPAEVAAAAEVEEGIVAVETNPENLFVDIIKGVDQANDEASSETTLDLPADSLLSGQGRLLSRPEGFIQIKVVDSGALEVDEDNNIVRTRQALLDITKEGVTRGGIRLDVLLQQEAEGARIRGENIEEDSTHPDWNRQLVEEVFATVMPSFRQRLNQDIVHIDPHWRAARVDLNRGRFRIGFIKEDVAQVPPLPLENDVFPGPDDVPAGTS
ncbi:MAG: hypothetical protein HY344_01255 [Candidatus Levybacteria bacterium]|nr:hypothetical protein [Candidatus Levybacteria bacterium]